MATFWEKSAHSVDHVFSLHFDYVILAFSRFDYEGGIWVLIAPILGHCILFTFCNDLCDE